MGYFIPVKTDGIANAAALRAAGQKLDALLQLTELEVDEMIEDVKQLRGPANRPLETKRI